MERMLLDQGGFLLGQRKIGFTLKNKLQIKIKYSPMPKNFLLLIVFVFAQLLSAQDADKKMVTQVTYDHSFKIFEKDSTLRHENMSLLLDGFHTSFMEANQYKLDSVYAKNGVRLPSTMEEATLINPWKDTNNPYKIFTAADELSYFRSLNKVKYEYQEETDLNWQLVNEAKSILGYECKKATVSYGGRNWTAWYALSLPFNAGPYTFKGLPGLILEVVDETGDFQFTAIGIEKIAMSEFHQLEPKRTNDVSIITREKFLKQLKAYDMMSVMERINVGALGTRIINSYGEDLSDRREYNQRPTEIRVYIE